jgi:hypothetical protein
MEPLVRQAYQQKAARCCSTVRRRAAANPAMDITRRSCRR